MTRDTRVARWAVSAVFFLTGAGTANWAVRIPAVQSALALSDGRLGIALLGVSAGAIVAMPIAGHLVAKHGSRPVTWIAALFFALTLVLPARAPSFALLAAALVALGLANGVLDVAMNAQAAAVQRRYAEPIMGRVHALYSFGGLVGAVIGGRVAAAGIAPSTHLTGTGLAIAVAASVVVIGMLPGHTDAAPLQSPSPGQLRVLLPLGVLAFCVLFGEGTMMNWSAVYLRNVIRTGPGMAAAGFAAFSLMMTVGRAVGDTLTMRFGAVALARAGGVLAVVGVAAALGSSHALPVVIGFGAVGAGLSIIFPMVLAAAARSPGLVPGAAIAMVSMCGYSGLLAGPPLIGAVASVTSLRGGLALVMVTSALVLVLARAVGGNWHAGATLDTGVSEQRANSRTAA